MTTATKQARTMKWRIGRIDKPGYFWNTRTHEWKSQMSGDYTTYTTKGKAMAAAQRPARVYSPIHIEQASS